MAQVFPNNNTRTLTRFFKRLNQGEDSEGLRKEACRLLTSIELDDIATAEQSLIDDGYPIQIVQLLSATFMLMGIPEENSGNPRTWLPANHVLSKVVVEHDLMRCYLADLNDVTNLIEQMDHLSDVSCEFRKLSHIAEHLDAMKEHIEREENILFPCLTKYGKISLCNSMHGDHVTIVTEINNLVNLVVSINKLQFDQFKAGLTTTTDQLLSTIPEHLSQEDMILFPVALGIIRDNAVWERLKYVCDEIGYCGVHL